MTDERFEDGKADGALRTIGEVSKALDIKPHVLRYWEQQFPRLDPLKRAGGRRYYRPEDVAMVENIDRLVNREGYTLKGAASILESGAETAESNTPTDEARIPAGTPELAREMAADEAGTLPASIATPISGIPAETIAKLKTIRAGLAAALEA